MRRHALLLVLAAVAWTGGLHGGISMAEGAVLMPVADTTVRTDLGVRRNDNHGLQQDLAIGTGRGGNGPYGAADAFRSYIWFDVSALSTENVARATLELTILRFGFADVSPYAIDVHRVLGAWVEGNGYEGPSSDMVGAPPGAVWVDEAFGLDWDTQPPFDPVVTASAAVQPTLHGRGSIIEWDITALVNDWIDDPTGNFGLMLRDMTSFGDFRNVSFGSRENETWDYPGTPLRPLRGPRLVVGEAFAVPEPSTVVLVLGGLVALLLGPARIREQGR